VTQGQADELRGGSRSPQRGSLDAGLYPMAGGVGQRPSLVLLERVASTMDAARRLALMDPRIDGLVVLGDLQERGRGRFSRSWLAPPGSGLTFSVVLRPRIEESQQLWAMAGVGVASGVQRLGVDVGLKWPNDVLVAGRKLCGILVEASWSGNVPQHAVIGVGCNVNLDVERVPGIADTATSLSRELGHPVSRLGVLHALLEGLSEAGRLLARDPVALLQRYRAVCVVRGRRVIVTAGGSPALRGVVLDVDQDGCLVLRDEAGTVHRLAAGEVSLIMPPAGDDRPSRGRPSGDRR